MSSHVVWAPTPRRLPSLGVGSLFGMECACPRCNLPTPCSPREEAPVEGSRSTTILCKLDTKGAHVTGQAPERQHIALQRSPFVTLLFPKRDKVQTTILMFVCALPTLPAPPVSGPRSPPYLAPHPSRCTGDSRSRSHTAACASSMPNSRVRLMVANSVATNVDSACRQRAIVTYNTTVAITPFHVHLVRRKFHAGVEIATAVPHANLITAVQRSAHATTQ